MGFWFGVSYPGLGIPGSFLCGDFGRVFGLWIWSSSAAILGGSVVGPDLPFMVPANIPKNSERPKQFFSGRREVSFGDLFARLVPA